MTNAHIILKYRISMLVNPTKKQSNEYDIDWVGLPNTVAAFETVEGNSN